jgi:hypothetical protein
MVTGSDFSVGVVTACAWRNMRVPITHIGVVVADPHSCLSVFLKHAIWTYPEKFLTRSLIIAKDYIQRD